MLSNFKEYKKQFYSKKKKIIFLTKLPNFILFLLPTNHTDFKSEISTLRIPIANLQSTSTSSEYFLYDIPGNINMIQAINFIITLIQHAINDGKKKKSKHFMSNKITYIKYHNNLPYTN